MDGLSDIFARNCEVRRIDKASASSFFDLYHRLGSTTCRYRYGLFVRRRTGAGELSLPEGTMVAAAGFSNARRWQKEGTIVSSYEWIRYASLRGVRVVGGMGKLLDAFVEDIRPSDVMTYADLSWPDGGKTYGKLGFEQEGTVERGGSINMKYRKKFQ